MTIHAPRASSEAIAAIGVRHLEAAIRVDSQSDEASPTIPSTKGQARLADAVAETLAGLGATIERDASANVIATIPGRGVPDDASPLALLVHLDTSRGTAALKELLVEERWEGGPIAYPLRPSLVVDRAHYPETSAFVGHDLLHGPGDAPFGLDNKLGLAQILTLAELLAEDERAAHPPLVLVARPDEEIGRMDAVRGLADTLAARGVTSGFTIDGILPFEINVENFNAAGASVWFVEGADPPEPPSRDDPLLLLRLGGVNTHGATARAEGHRAATRLAAEIVARLEASGLAPGAVAPVAFASDPVRDCDGEVLFVVRGEGATLARRAREALEESALAVVAPHAPRGAWLELTEAEPGAPSAAARPGGTLAMLRFVRRLIEDAPGFPIAAEASSGREGYTAPYRALPDGGRVRLDLRLRDFEPAGLARREKHLRALARDAGAAEVACTPQYVNMGPALSDRPELVAWPREAARRAGYVAREAPIRGGTGVDPFLERGVGIANLGTGYFAPESEKEFTSRQMLAAHVAWLFALVQVVAAEPRPA